jgi:sugar lactone lactonase YvrE
MQPKATILVETTGFPECPRWRGGELWFTLSNRIMVMRPDGTLRVFGELNGHVALGLAFLDDGSVLSGSAFQRKIYRLFPDGGKEIFADLANEVADITNECVVGRDGSVYVGSVGFEVLKGDAPRPTRLIRIAPDGVISRVGPELFMPNGMALSDDSRTLYVAESMGARITALSVDDDGDIKLARVVADLSASDADHPDGLALAPDGSLYYAAPLVPGGLIVHVSSSGSEIARFKTGLPHSTSCALGGISGRSLFVTATDAMVGGDEAQTQRAVIVAIELEP